MVVALLEGLDAREWRLQQLLRWRYGATRERVNENQLLLFAVEMLGRGAGNRDRAGGG
jgi:hypothetical protein